MEGRLLKLLVLEGCGLCMQRTFESNQRRRDRVSVERHRDREADKGVYERMSHFMIKACSQCGVVVRIDYHSEVQPSQCPVCKNPYSGNEWVLDIG